MRPTALALPLLVLLALGGPAEAAGDWAGEWVTDLGAMTLTQDGSSVEGTYGEGARLEGEATGRKLTVTWQNGQNRGTGSFERAEDGASFTGSWTGGGGGGTWRGWRKDPDAESARTANFAGTWVSSLGTMVLEQKGTKVEGTYGSQGWATVEGEVKGRRLHLKWKRIQWSGDAWIEATKDGKRFFGLTAENPPTKWLGLRLEGFEREVKPTAGEVVRGLTSSAMLYHLRAPDGWRKGKKADAIVLLHGSNWTTAGMVWVTAKNWPDLGKRFFVVGLQGEQWADWSEADDLRHNYTYVNWMGRSTYKGYPYTDRESPFLVAKAIEELKALYGFERVFLGGHSQGGYLTWIVAMHHPELIDGAFPMSCGLVMQAEPDVFEDEELKAAQRRLPLAVVHGANDDVVSFSDGQYIHERFRESAFPALRLFAPPLGHGYDFLPIGDVIAWLDGLSTQDPDALLAFAKARADAGEWRDVSAALLRADQLKARRKLAALEKALDEAAAKEADAWLAKIDADEDASWIDGFLAWKAQFEFAPAALKAMTSFEALRAEHDPEAQRLIGEARQAMNNGDRDAGWAKYQQVLDEFYAARRYPVVKRWVAERD
jgi:predicted esterase